MTQQTPEDRAGSDRTTERDADLTPPSAPLQMPRQCLESPRQSRDWLISRAMAPRRG